MPKNSLCVFSYCPVRMQYASQYRISISQYIAIQFWQVMLSPNTEAFKHIAILYDDPKFSDRQV